MIKNRWFRTGTGLVLIIALLSIVDLEKVFLSLKSLEVKWLLAAAGCIICSTLLGAFNAHLLINNQDSIELAVFFPIYWLAWAVSLITPGQIGDIATISTLLKKQGIDWHLSLGRSLLDKLLSFVVMIILAGSGIYLASLHHLDFEQANIVLLWLIAIVILSLLLTRKKIISFFSPQLSGIRGLIGRTMQEALFTIQQRPVRVMINFFLTIIKILLIGLSYWCIFKGMGTAELDVIKTIALSAASSLVAYIPVSFNGIGTVEASGLFLFSQLGLTSSVILAGYVVLRLLVMTLAWLPSFLILLFWRSKVTK